jgi:hypothetical protein
LPNARRVLNRLRSIKCTVTVIPTVTVILRTEGVDRKNTKRAWFRMVELARFKQSFRFPEPG